MSELRTSWACPTRLGSDGKVEKRGCGGNWGATAPKACPRCDGPLLTTQKLAIVDLAPGFDGAPHRGGRT